MLVNVLILLVVFSSDNVVLGVFLLSSGVIICSETVEELVDRFSLEKVTIVETYFKLDLTSVDIPASDCSFVVDFVMCPV